MIEHFVAVEVLRRGLRRAFGGTLFLRTNEDNERVRLTSTTHLASRVMSTVSCSGRLFSLGLAPIFFFFLAGEGEGCEPLAVAFVGDSDEDSSEDSDDEGGTFRFSGEVSFEAKCLWRFRS